MMWDLWYNLGIFSYVEITNENNDYNISVKEIFRYYPLPLLDFDESKGKDGTSYGFALNILNLNGRNRQLEIGGMYGNKNIYFLRYQDPWILGDHVSLNINLFQILYSSFWYENQRERDFTIQLSGLEVGTGFNIKYKNKFLFNIGLIKNNIKFIDDYFLFSNLITNYKNIVLDFEYSYDSRNIFNDPTQGNLFKIAFNHAIGLKESNSYSNLQFEYNKYYMIHKFRELTFISSSKLFLQKENHIPIFKYESLGSEDFVRGYNPYPNQNPEQYQNRIRYPQILTQSFEFQYTIIEKKSYDGFEFGIDNSVFIDFGLGGNSIKDLKENKPLIGFGTGLKFFISGVGTISLNLGFNPTLKNPQIHISDGTGD